MVSPLNNTGYPPPTTHCRVICGREFDLRQAILHATRLRPAEPETHKGRASRHREPEHTPTNRIRIIQLGKQRATITIVHVRDHHRQHRATEILVPIREPVIHARDIRAWRHGDNKITPAANRRASQRTHRQHAATLIRELTITAIRRLTHASEKRAWEKINPLHLAPLLVGQ